MIRFYWTGKQTRNFNSERELYKGRELSGLRLQRRERFQGRERFNVFSRRYTFQEVRLKQR